MEALTYLIANHDNAAWLPDCLASLRDQTDPEWRAIVCDDASSDASLAVLAAWPDTRIRVIANAVNRGYIGVLEQLIAAAETDLVAILDSDDALAPEATARLRAAAAAVPAAGLIWSRFQVFGDGPARRAEIGGEPPAAGATSLENGFISHLKAFRRGVYARTAGLDEGLSYAEDRDLVYQLEELTRPLFIDAVLYRHRRRAGSQSQDRDKHEIGLRSHHAARERALRRRGIGGVQAGLYRAFFRLDYLSRTRRVPATLQRLLLPLLRGLLALDTALGLRRGGRLRRPPRLACYLWRYPLLSETFIQREIAALRRHGLDLTVIADAPGELDTLDPSTRALTSGVEYLLPPRLAALPGALLAPLLQRPRALFQVLAAVYRTRYIADRDWRTDLRVAGKTLYLARRLRTLGIAHAYSPWGEANAFILKLAAGLAGIGHSVQFRAHELYQDGAVLAVAEKIAGARFVVSNCAFHLPRLRPHLPARGAPPLHVVYEGLDLARFPERLAEPGATGRLRILSVARLLDCKGLEVLLRACARLQQAGVGFDCRVIGGPDPRHQRDYPARLEALRATLGLGGTVAFLGARPYPEVHAAYYRADVFALPVVTGADGIRDITPNALLEAMAAGLPVISSRQTAIPEIVEDGVSGLLIDPGDDAALAAHLSALAADAPRRAALGRAARRRIAERFDSHRNTRVLARALVDAARSARSHPAG